MGNKLDLKKVFIAGGTGFLGYYSALEFLKKGVAVDTISLPDIPLGKWFPADKIGVKYGNLFEMKKEELVEIFRGYDALVYAVGPDDRVHSPKGVKAYDFFYDRLVVAVKKVFEAAKEAGVKKAVVLNSYFAYFDRVKPELKLAERHPYIKVRTEQSKELIAVGGGVENGGMDVVILELPYIFGAMPERMPLWKGVFLDRFAGMPAVFFPKGGTNMIHCTGVAEGVVAATYYGQHADKLPIGGDNKKYSFMINSMMEVIGAKKRCVTLPTSICTIGGKVVAHNIHKVGQESGLDYKRLMKDIQSRDYYFDPNPVREYLHFSELGFKGGLSLQEGIKATMMACYPHRFDKDGNLKPEWNGINPTKLEPKDNDPALKNKKK
ncbi:MAG: NAD(P)-dependent oxidoreductase [Clostridia bacterium]